jgi:hypothetical protein
VLLAQNREKKFKIRIPNGCVAPPQSDGPVGSNAVENDSRPRAAAGSFEHGGRPVRQPVVEGGVRCGISDGLPLGLFPRGADA